MEPIRKEKTPRRNAKCPCGSGKKAKRCCLNKIKALAALPPAVREQVVAAKILGHWPTLEQPHERTASPCVRRLVTTPCDGQLPSGAATFDRLMVGPEPARPTDHCARPTACAVPRPIPIPVPDPILIVPVPPNIRDRCRRTLVRGPSHGGRSHRPGPRPPRPEPPRPRPEPRPGTAGTAAEASHPSQDRIAMKTPRSLSYSSMTLWEKNPEEFYLRYLAEHPAPRLPQEPPMAVGSAFDAYVKAALNYALSARPCRPSSSSMQSSRARSSRRTGTSPSRPASTSFEAYKLTGAYDELLKLLRAIRRAAAIRVQGRWRHCRCSLHRQAGLPLRARLRPGADPLHPGLEGPGLLLEVCRQPVEGLHALPGRLPEREAEQEPRHAAHQLPGIQPSWPDGQRRLHGVLQRRVRRPALPLRLAAGREAGRRERGGHDRGDRQQAGQPHCRCCGSPTTAPASRPTTSRSSWIGSAAAGRPSPPATSSPT